MGRVCSLMFWTTDMTCEQTHELIHAYTDGELDLLRNVEVEHHLGECEACRSQHQDQLYLQSLIKGEAQYFVAPDILKRRVKNQIHRPTTAPRWIAAAAVLILALAGVLLWTIISNRSRSHTDELVAQEIVSS